ncbi:Cytochrome [Forsythia ovata]|uniref:Cytochrome n=1 Tax=Forsythia ovata TaxID=205694 RepID=A0ABD1S770_9LAMI
MDVTLSSIFTSIIIVAFIRWSFQLINWVWLRPKKLEKCLRNQGLNGNPYRIFIGDMKDLIRFIKETQPRSIKISDDLAPRISHYYYQSIHKFGENSFIWFGPSPRLNIEDPELFKEILSKPDVFQKPAPDLGSIIVGGLLFLEGEKWAKHREIVTPAFHLHKLKNTLLAIRLSCSSMFHKWEALVWSNERSCEIDVWPYLEDLSGDMISRTAFASSHEEGIRIFQLQKEQVKLALEILQWSFIPGWRYFPTKANRCLKAISKEIQSLLRGIVSKREKAMERGETVSDDLLGLLMKSNLQEIQEHGNKNMGMSIEDVIEECKLFYFAGSETTSNFLVWTMVLLSQHQEWQARAREEVFQVFGKEEPTAEGLHHLKTVTMILQEVLRLYPPAPLTVRTCTETVKLKNMTLPAGVQMSVLIGQLHHNPKIWGDDSKEFKPQRFLQGISGVSYMPFSSGPRICIGQNLAMIEAKTALAMILQRFSFEFSSSYKHSPFPIITLQPQYGAPLILQKL